MLRPAIFVLFLQLSACGDYRECDFVGEDRCDGNVIMACTKSNGRDKPFGTDLWERMDCAGLGLVCVEGSHSISSGAWCTDPAFECPDGLYSACDGTRIFRCTSEGPVYAYSCTGTTPFCVPREDQADPPCAYFPEPCAVEGMTRCHEDGFVICEKGHWTGREWCFETGSCEEDENGYAYCVD